MEVFENLWDWDWINSLTMIVVGKTLLSIGKVAVNFDDYITDWRKLYT